MKGVKKMDGLLKIFNDQAMTNLVQIGVTINTGGLLISGMLASPKDLQSIVSEQFIASGNDFAVTLGKSISEIDFSQDSEETSESELIEEYITLKEVKILLGQESLNAPFWRIKAASIDSYTLGRL